MRILFSPDAPGGSEPPEEPTLEELQAEKDRLLREQLKAEIEALKAGKKTETLEKTHSKQKPGSKMVDEPEEHKNVSVREFFGNNSRWIEKLI